MLDYIRSNAQSYGVKLAFGLIILVFVFWGVGSFTDKSSGGAVASVNGEAIPVQRFESAYQNAEEAALRNTPGITREELKKQGLGLHVLQELSADILLRQAAEKHGISVSPVELRLAVGQMKIFQDAQGRFDPEAYKRVLAAQRTSPAQYEQSVGASLLRDKLYAMLTSTAWVGPDEAKNYYDFLRQTRRVEYVFFPAKADAASPSASPSDEEMRAYYEARKDDFTLPPKVVVEYVAVRPESLTGQDSADNDAAARGALTEKLHEVLDSLLEDNILNKNLADSAARFGLKAEKTALLSQAEIEQALGLPQDKALVFFSVGGAGTAVDTVLEAGEQFLVTRVLDAVPRALCAFDDVKNDIAARLQVEKNLAAAKEQARQMIARLEGTTPANADAKKERDVQSADLKRMGALADFEPNAVLDEAIFASAPSRWLPTVFEVDSKTHGPGALICRTVSIEAPDNQEWQSMQSLMESITARERVDSFFQAFMLNLASGAKVEILNPNIIERKGL
jgi:hypothetical protein